MTNEVQTGVRSNKRKDRQTDGRKDKHAARQEGRSRHNGWQSRRQTSASSQRQIGSKGIRKRDKEQESRKTKSDKQRQSYGKVGKQQTFKSPSW